MPERTFMVVVGFMITFADDNKVEICVFTYGDDDDSDSAVARFIAPFPGVYSISGAGR